MLTKGLTRGNGLPKRFVPFLILFCASALLGGCKTTEGLTAPKVECRGREYVPITPEQVETEAPEILAPKVINNENLEREGCVKAPNPSGKLPKRR